MTKAGLTDQQLEGWDGDGFVVVRRLVEPVLVAALRDRAVELSDAALEDRSGAISIDHRRDPVFARVARHPGLRAAVGSLLGPDIDCLASRFVIVGPGAAEDVDPATDTRAGVDVQATIAVTPVTVDPVPAARGAGPSVSMAPGDVLMSDPGRSSSATAEPSAQPWQAVEYRYAAAAFDEQPSAPSPDRVPVGRDGGLPT